MDAKPQRPFRPLRVPGDENLLPPINPAGKTLHHRNKSTPALSTLAGPGRAKNALKRTAFGDLSNTACATRPLRDDAAVSDRRGSSKAVVNAKPVNVAQGNDRMKKGLQHSSVSISSDEPAALRLDGVYIEKTGEIKLYSPHETADRMHEKPVASSKAKLDITSNAEVVSTKAVADHVGIPSENSGPTRVKHDRVHLPSEPEEYWDEDDDDNYEEEEYVTARSHRSRDNTTGGATVLLMPKVTQKVQRELGIAKQIVEATRTPEDIEDEAWDTSMVAEYSDEIFQYMRELEMRLLPNAHYMDNQAEIQWSMRSVLMDWLVQVHHRFSLLPETLFLCVNYIDRFLSCKIVSLGKLQLVGATAIFIAAKYEEINCPSLQEIIYMVDNGYTADEILKAERFMLSMLQFELGWPGPMSFLRRISKADDYDLETRTLAKYFLEITIMDERFVAEAPMWWNSAGAHCLARLMLRKGTWTPAHVYYSNYTYSQLYPLVSLILECCENPEKHHSAVYEKYSDRRFKRASTFVKAEMMKKFKLPEATREGSAAHLINLFEDPSIWRRQ
ncbi:G2/mitotic-specific cyclin cdc13 [Histoplasma capsulatum G186AR]|uniref:G2/mitotic-specific cyclin cdc13 n=1 Tax=Ajellomyces capsulatus (strain G186AR / H82 / ATCC MYA-2454 / RMSCC 2432) TaxID=447093 RepID=C0NWJ2_AJECG|nr:G2/mitotic-specific cyclin cdc13 [Histoplasma capsulatum G186AR]EEH04297.1 G2/mitotic-specific cyclin cdc13 [Histoplasma capsulatum G186AR]